MLRAGAMARTAPDQILPRNWSRWSPLVRGP